MAERRANQHETSLFGTTGLTCTFGDVCDDGCAFELKTKTAPSAWQLHRDAIAEFEGFQRMPIVMGCWSTYG